jgi:hypothetical protein
LKINKFSLKICTSLHPPARERERERERERVFKALALKLTAYQQLVKYKVTIAGEAESVTSDN